jgi:hypothetical protein
MPVQQPILVVCRGGGQPHMLTVSESGYYLDDGEVYEMAARDRPFAPAGQGGEAIFTALWITTTSYDDPITLFITPIVDFVPLETQQLDLVGAVNAENRTEVHELALSVPYVVGGIERMRNAPRGCYIDVRVETNFGGIAQAASRFSIDGIEVEVEIVRDSRVAVQ